MNRRRSRKLASLFIMIMILMSGCTSGTQAKTSTTANAIATTSTLRVPVTPEDTDTAWDESTATKITLSGTTAEVNGSGAQAEGGIVTISAAGVYVLTGTLTAGQIYINAAKTDAVRLVLNGADITAAKNAAIYCAQADKLIVTLEQGTQNTITDAKTYTYADTAAEEPDAAFFSNNDLTLNGSGTLTVNASFKNGIGTKDDLVIAGGRYEITAENDGLRGRDSIGILDGVLRITAGSDGIQSNNDEDASKGWIALEGGTYTITAAHDGIQAETTLSVSGGTYTMQTGGGNTTKPASSTTSDSYKGIKAGSSVVIDGGAFTMDCADDAVHSNGNIYIGGGEFTIKTGDDGAHADADLTIADGKIKIETSYEGLEGMTINLAGGAIDLLATDDGINSAGGSDSSAEGGENGAEGRFGKDQFAASDNCIINITGGEIKINASGDGIDANGNVTMSGGTVLVSGPTNGGNGALDYVGTFILSGGVLVAAGSTGMAQSPSTNSTQASLMLYYSTVQKAGTSVELSDSSGKTLISFTPEKDYQCVVLSAPEMKHGETYTVSSGGTKVVDIALSGSVTSISDTGEAVTGNAGGPGGRGGMGGPNGQGRQRPENGQPNGTPPPGQPQGETSSATSNNIT